jgi:hypothetical protein
LLARYSLLVDQIPTFSRQKIPEIQDSSFVESSTRIRAFCPTAAKLADIEVLPLEGSCGQAVTLGILATNGDSDTKTKKSSVSQLASRYLMNGIYKPSHTVTMWKME